MPWWHHLNVSFFLPTESPNQCVQPTRNNDLTQWPNCIEQAPPQGLPMLALHGWVTAMLQTTANSGRHHEMLSSVRTYKELITFKF